MQEKVRRAGLFVRTTRACACNSFVHVQHRATPFTFHDLSSILVARIFCTPGTNPSEWLPPIGGGRDQRNLG